MKYLLVMFVSPAYFALRGKWGAFTFNLILYLLAIVTLLFGIGVFFWMVGVMHAGWSLRTEVMEEHATIMAKKLAEELRKPNA